MATPNLSPLALLPKRLNQAGVLEILRTGKRLTQPSFELRLLVLPPDRAPPRAKMAIAVPKRLLKSAVARNRIKRLVREGFRLHDTVGYVPAHMLVTFKAKDDGRKAASRRAYRAELTRLLGDAVRRAGPSRPSGAAA